MMPKLFTQTKCGEIWKFSLTNVATEILRAHVMYDKSSNRYEIDNPQKEISKLVKHYKY